jgi:outer membrane receptor protein involved in Fe transport
MGYLSGFTQGAGQFLNNREKVWGFYAQDSWKVTHRLTLNYGIRYEYTPFFTRRRRSPSSPPQPRAEPASPLLIHQPRSCFHLRLTVGFHRWERCFLQLHAAVLKSYPHPCNGAGRSGKGGAYAEVCTSAARKIGETACGRVGAGP